MFGPNETRSFHVFAPSTDAVRYVTGRENVSRSSGSFAVKNSSVALRPPAAAYRTTVVSGRTSQATCSSAGASAGSVPQSRYNFPPASKTTLSGCVFHEAQCVVSPSVSRSCGDHTEKNGSHVTSGTAGGRRGRGAVLSVYAPAG